LEWVKFNAIDPATGKYLSETGTVSAFLGTAPFAAQTVVAGTGGPGDPAASLAISTATGIVRGLASKGRFFPPSGGIEGSVGYDGMFASASRAAMVDSAVQLLDDLNVGAMAYLVVFSKKGQTARRITGLRVGSVVDHQSRRRRNLLENYGLGVVS
jgi:hypothetical protein